MEIEVAEPSLANAHCIGQHGLEYVLKLAWRTRNDAQHLGGRRLLLQRLGELSRTLLKLLLQLARVRLELLFRRSLRFLRRVKMTHVGRPKAEDLPIGKHTTPAPPLCEV